MNTTRILRHANARNCIRLLRDKGPMSRADLARELGATRTTIGYAVRELMDLGLVSSGGPAGLEGLAQDGIAQKGRPGTAVYIEPAGAYFFGAEISADHLTIVLSDLTLNPVCIKQVEVNLKNSVPEEIIDLLLQWFEPMVAQAAIPESKIYGLGVSLSGIITPDGRVFLPSLSAWHNINLSGMLRKRLPDSWVIQCCNDAAALALTLVDDLSEEDKEDLLVIMLATNGIGSARVRRGVIDKGAHGIAGEVGLMRLSGEPSDVNATFQFLSGAAEIASFVDTSNPVETVLRNAEANKTNRNNRVLDKWSDVLATGLLNVVYLLDPAHIIMAGPLAVMYPRVSRRVDAILQKALIPGLEHPRISVPPPNSEDPRDRRGRNGPPTLVCSVATYRGMRSLIAASCRRLRPSRQHHYVAVGPGAPRLV